MDRMKLRQRVRHSMFQSSIAILAYVFASSIMSAQLSTAWRVSNVVSPTESVANMNEIPRGYSKTLLQQPDQQSVFYVESWKKGPGQVRERSFHIEFCKQDQEYRGEIEDFKGETRYRLLLVPVLTGNEPHHIGWAVQLYEADGQGAENSFLQPARGKGHDFRKEDSIARLYPEENPGLQTNYLGIPLSSKRVIKVESFYCIIQVKSYTILSQRKGFAWISIDIDFRNKYIGPRDRVK